MKTHNDEMKVSVLALAVQCALLATFALPLSAYADEADALKHPINTVDFGALYSSQSSARFGQYNGLNEEGFYGLGGFDVRGGDGYDTDKNSALRWKLNGSDLGTTSRNLDASVSEQGKWKLNLGYDELQHNITDTFQTPLQGETGGNNFTLPANFGPINSATTNTRSLTANQLGDFHTEKEYTTRRNGSVGTSYSFTDQLSAQIDYNHLEQSGAKLIGTGSQGGINVGNGIGSTGIKGAGEAVNIIMNPTSYSTDNVNATLNWKGDKGHLTGGYYGSLFHDDYNSLSWQNALVTPGTGAGLGSTCAGANCYTNNTMSTAPSNSLHQANLNGGYNFSQATKLAGSFSYGYNTQNSSYAPTLIPQANGTSFDMMRTGLPSSSLNGLVETTHVDIKLTNQSVKDLTLSTGFKYNERDNRTDSATYLYKNIRNNGTTDNYIGVNTPYSNRKMQYEAAADYRLTNKQKLNLAYEHESLKRWCDGVVGGAECVSSPTTEEDKIGLNYRLKAFDDVSFNAGYGYASRRVDTAHFLANTGSYGVFIAGVSNSFDAGNAMGYVAYPFAGRDQHLGKAGVTWQATSKLDLGVNGRISHDDYDMTLGLKNGKSASVNVDATYNYTDNGSVSVYWSWQNAQRFLRRSANGNSTTIQPSQFYNNKLDEDSHAVGLTAKQGGLLNNKLEIVGDMSYSFDTSGYSTQLFYNPNAATCGAATSLTCGSLSPITNELISLKLTGNYKILKNGKVSLSYLYQKLNSNDYFYNGQQLGYTPSTLMPTNFKEQDYTVNVVALSYSYAF